MIKKIRKGGIETKSGYLFELTGGDCALDLPNTLDNRPTNYSRELIPTYAALLSWAHQLRILNRSQELRLEQQAKRYPKDAEAARKQTVELRECLFEMFSSIADGGSVTNRVLRRFEAFLRPAIHEHQLMQDQENVKWMLPQIDLHSITWVVAVSAADLLKSDRIHRIRRCAATKCDWLFLDTSKRGNRRWCDMTVCGNRAKASSFYLRKKKRQKA